MANRALILIDIQNDYFESGAWPVHRMEDVVDNAAQLLHQARKAGDVIVHVRHEMQSADAPFFRPGTSGSAIHAAVAPTPDEPVIVKYRPNGFIGTDLLARLRSQDVEEVTICGAMSQMCIDATTRAAVDHGFKVTLIEDACGAKETSFNGCTVSAEQVHAAFMAPLASSYAKVRTCADYLAEITQQ